MQEKLYAWFRFIWHDLLPVPGRLNNSLRIVLTTSIALVIMMVLRMPFISIGLYFIFLVSHEGPSISLRTGLMFMATLTSSVIVELAVVILTDNDPMARVVSVAIVAFVAALLWTATTLSAFPLAWGFIYWLLIAFCETHASANDFARIAFSPFGFSFEAQTSLRNLPVANIADVSELTAAATLCSIA